MKTINTLLFIVIVSLSFSAYGGGKTEALKKLKQTVPKTKWSEKTALKIDIDCDGKSDYVFLSQNREAAQVGLVLGRNKGKSVFTQKIAFKGDSQNCLSIPPAIIMTESLDYDPTDAVGELPGFIRSKSCNAFALGAGGSDAFHFFWNHKHDKLEWWRL